jgi:hypothetical protein
MLALINPIGPTPFQPFVAVQMILIKYMVRGIHIYKQQFGNIPNEFISMHADKKALAHI